MKMKLLLVGLVLALGAPAVQAAGLHLQSCAVQEKIDVPALVSLLGSPGDSLANFRGRLVSNPRSWLRSHQGAWLRNEHQSTYNDPEGGTGGGTPSVPEPEGLAGVLAASVLVGLAGYRFGQRRRVLGAA
jgi:hypothetical protein